MGNLQRGIVDVTLGDDNVYPIKFNPHAIIAAEEALHEKFNAITIDADVRTLSRLLWAGIQGADKERRAGKPGYLTVENVIDLMDGVDLSELRYHVQEAVLYMNQQATVDEVKNAVRVMRAAGDDLQQALIAQLTGQALKTSPTANLDSPATTSGSCPSASSTTAQTPTSGPTATPQNPPPRPTRTKSI